MLDYKTLIDARSMYNTPNCWSIYMMGLVLHWIENEVGGLAEMEKRNNAKAQLLYDYLDQSSFFHNPVNKADRSIMNVTFTSPSKEMDAKFCQEAQRPVCQFERSPQRGRYAPLSTTPCRWTACRHWSLS